MDFPDLEVPLPPAGLERDEPGTGKSPKWIERHGGLRVNGTDEGVADFHALRVTYATSLARSGVSPAMAQKLLRHSDPKLTLNIYTRLKLEEAQAAVARLPLPEDL